MLFSTISKELKARYKGSILGFLWTFINPLLQLLVYSLLFRYIMRIKVPGVNYTLFLFVGLVSWTCFSSSLVMGSSVIFTNSNLIKKIFFPRLLLPLASVLGNIVNLLLTLCIMIPVLWISGYGPSLAYLSFPLVLVIQILLNLGFVLILSALFVYFRDIEHILNVLLMAWMYLTPIIYNDDFLPGNFYHLAKLNPMFPIVLSYQKIFLYGEFPEASSLLYVASFSVFLVFLGHALFNALQRRFAEEL